MLWKDRSVHTQIRTSPAGQEGHPTSHAETGAQEVQDLCAEVTFLDKPWKHEDSTFRRGSCASQLKTADKLDKRELLSSPICCQ